MVVGLAANAAGQSTEPAGPGQALPVRPAAGSWPSFPSGASPFYPPEVKPVAATLPSLDSLKPMAFTGASSTGNGWSVGGSPPATTSPNLPPFAGLGAAKPAGNQAVSATGALIPAGSNSGAALFPDRSPKDFGSGWKTFLNQQLHNRERSGSGPAAQLAAPRSASSSGPRPDWNWHGYDGYNMGQTRRVGPAMDNAGASDLAPYMKYAHLWRPAGRVAGAAAPATPAKNNPALTHASFDRTSTAPPIDDASSRWSGYGKTSTPENAKPASHLEAPVSAPADAGGIQFHAAAPEARPPAPLPPLPPIVPPVDAAAKPASPLNVNYPPAPAEPTNRLPLQVREKISQICNGRCRNLVVETISPIRLRIGFLVKDQSEADMLTNQLGGAAELAPYKVDFEVQIGQ
jgi:hypothetical protein